MTLENSQLILPGVLALHRPGLEEFPLLRFSRWQIGPQEVLLNASTTGVRALQLLLGLSSNQSSLAGISCALNVPLVNTVPCIRNLRNTIHRFPEDKVRKGRMDCMRRWRIQGTVESHPYVHLFILPSLFVVLWNLQRKRMEFWRNE